MKSNSKNAQTSITNVAALANVSTATVSRVLSGHRRKEDDISRRVRLAATQLNYSVNFVASALRSEAIRTVGVVIPQNGDHLSMALLEEISAQADARSQYILLKTRSDAVNESSVLLSLAKAGVDSLLAISPEENSTGKTLMDISKDLPTVQVCGFSSHLHYSWVGIDSAASMTLAINHLAEQNAKSIAFLSQELHSPLTTILFTAFYSRVSMLNLVPDPDYVQFGSDTVQRGFDAGMSLLNSNNTTAPDAFICCADSVAIGVLMACKF